MAEITTLAIAAFTCYLTFIFTRKHYNENQFKSALITIKDQLVNLKVASMKLANANSFFTNSNWDLEKMAVEILSHMDNRFFEGKCGILEGQERVRQLMGTYKFRLGVRHHNYIADRFNSVIEIGKRMGSTPQNIRDKFPYKEYGLCIERTIEAIDLVMHKQEYRNYLRIIRAKRLGIKLLTSACTGRLRRR